VELILEESDISKDAPDSSCSIMSEPREAMVKTPIQVLFLSTLFSLLAACFQANIPIGQHIWKDYWGLRMRAA